MRKIPLRSRTGDIRAYALVDDADYDWLVKFNWFLHSGGYVCRNAGGRKDFHTVLMSRQILGLERGDPRLADHINRVRLDHQRCNLRIVNSQAENLQNFSSRNRGGSAYRGVFWDKARNKWRAGLTHNYKSIHLGRFDSEEEAHKAVVEFLKKHKPLSEEAVEGQTV